MKLNRSAWGRFALTHVAVATLSVASTAAWGLGLGRLSVQSALGETLSAEIDIAAITPEEAGTLRVRVAPPEAYRATGVEYNPVLTNTQVQLARRADGRPYLRIASDRAVQEPFVDVILEISWAGGRLVREYTLLFDPPSLARPTPPASVTTAPVIAAATPEARPLAPAAAAPAVAAPRPAAPAIAAAPAAASRPPAAPRAAPAPAPVPVAAAPAASPAAAPSAASQYTVKPGDSLSRVASRTKPAEVSLDQMLVGLYRNNPDAFIGENMNRLKAGVVLQVPTSDALSGVSTDEAKEFVAAQSADFAAYRERLASGAPELQAAQASRAAKGKVQAEVADRKPAEAPSPDKLKLSKAGASAPEGKVSKETERKDEAARVAELKRNVEELKQISSATKPGTAAPVASAPAPAPVQAALPAIAAAPVPASAVAPAAASAPAPAPLAKASASAPASMPMAAAQPEAVAEEPGLLEGLINHPLVIPVAGVLVALLGGLGLMRLRGRGSKPKSDTGFHESRLQPDSFFGASGGQRVDTRDATSGSSSMSYSLSQLDAIGDVDPVAEADVYLAYGRDLQAEEILKEALRANPDRLAIRLKLLEVYAKRRDIKGFEQLAIQLYAETTGTGEDWAKAQELGRLIDPDNPLYQPGGAPSQALFDEDHRPEPMNASTLPQTAQHSTIVGAHLNTEPLPRAALDGGPMSGLDLDLDLDMSSAARAPASPLAMEATQAMATTVEQAPLGMDFDLSSPPPASTKSAAETELGDLSFDLDELDAPTAPIPPDDAPTANALDFDLSSIDLDLPQSPDASAEATIPAAAATSMEADFPPEFDSLLQEQPSSPLSNAFDALDDEDGDPLQRQLELADEFRQIGDVEGARDVLQELLSKASGPIKEKAEAMLSELR
ncbi:FimV/HubP family polar landmark protein [Roseateles sp.]|uniref:FimV/HubP family polar landmark protein n=1 Tax=Roseateles sp. TaxID=1971397 RepID=UPI0037CC50CE